MTGSFRIFIDACFSSALLKKFYISYPNFLRDRKISEDGKPSYLNNVVLRHELTLSMRRYLPDYQNVILIGDICEGQKMKKFVVKGIQFIDESIIMFSGRYKKVLPKELVNSVNLLIDGPFVESKLDTKRILLGSENKNLSFITDRYKN